jgi:predicted kinase
MRGAPCSGKSFRALQLAEGNKNIIFSADKWFGENPETYLKNWSATKLFLAHQWCQEQLEAAMKSNISPVIVDNTNIKKRDIDPYILLANKYSYEIQFVESQSPWWLEIRELLKDKKHNADIIENWADKFANGFDYNGMVIKNVHNVPKETILKMLSAFEDF